jgi:hypothetical protein
LSRVRHGVRVQRLLRGAGVGDQARQLADLGVLGAPLAGNRLECAHDLVQRGLHWLREPQVQIPAALQRLRRERAVSGGASALDGASSTRQR